MFTDSTPIIESNKNITVHMKLSVLNELKNDVPLSYVASRHGISIQSVYNIFESFVSIDRHELPEVMCIDEFKNLRTEEGKYACVIYDPIHSKIIDVIENRRLERLEDYFYHINIKELERVKYLISDMYEPYRSIHKRFFPNSTHIVDHFHFARYVYDALDKVRITIMNEYGDRTPEYRLLKKYWHLYIKKASDIKDYEQYNPLIKRKTSTSDIISDSLALNDTFNSAYELKELFVLKDSQIHFETRNQELKDLIAAFRNSNIESFESLANTFDNWFEEIGNSYIRFGDKRLNNAYLEGMNNKIKSVKKMSYGCRSFYYFRNRLMYIINENEAIGRVDTSKIPRKPKNK